ncbi:hypothetical protein SUGI_0463040 [Cryptomeria japonica]|nr:hypothetical protein SUGI_0463040 [Cryptomeria japonica]
MSLSCLACHGVNSPSESFRSYSSSGSDGEGRCGAIVNCWSRKPNDLTPAEVTNNNMSSRVAPQPTVSSESPPGSPRLVRSRAVRRDKFRDWHIGEMTEEVRLWE